MHPAIMSASPNLHSIAFSIWETLATKSRESMIVRRSQVNLLTLSTKRVLDGLPRLVATMSES